MEPRPPLTDFRDHLDTRYGSDFHIPLNGRERHMDRINTRWAPTQYDTLYIGHPLNPAQCAQRADAELTGILSVLQQIQRAIEDNGVVWDPGMGHLPRFKSTANLLREKYERERIEEEDQRAKERFERGLVEEENRRRIGVIGQSWGVPPPFRGPVGRLDADELWNQFVRSWDHGETHEQIPGRRSVEPQYRQLYGWQMAEEHREDRHMADF